MTQPTPYTPAADFSADELANVGGRSTVRTAALDAELQGIATNLDGLNANIELIQRDDGQLRDGVAKLHTLAADVKALLVAGQGLPRGNWATATAYALRDLVVSGGDTFICAIAHTSGTFATDKAAGRWLLFALGTSAAASAVPFTPTATISASNVQSALEEADSENRALSAAALLAANTVASDLASTVTGKGDALLGVLQPFTGAIARTQHLKNADFVSVADFGADPTGVLDSTAAFAAACDTGKAVFVPRGTYQASFSLRNAQIIFGEGTRNASKIIPPAGATYVVQISSSAYGMASKQHCQVRDLSIENPNAVANCTGIAFVSSGVSQINDNHQISNVYISGFRDGINVAGRMILCTFYNVEIDSCTRNAWRSVTDTADYAFNLNTFISCRFISSGQEGFLHTGYNTITKLISCNVEGNNTANALVVAGMDFQDAEGLSLDSCYFELNGGSAVVDGAAPLNNSIGLRLRGDRCFNLDVHGCWMVQSGTLIAINVASGIIGGEIKGNRFAPLSGGFDIYVGDKLNGINAQPIVIDSSNYFSGQLSVKTDGAGLTSASVEQTGACQFIASAITLDLRAANKFSVSSASAVNLTTIDNRFPGMEMSIFNAGAGTVTVAASLMQSGVASSVVSGAFKRYMVLGFPAAGKFVEI